MGSLWTLVTILGPILLGLAIVYAIWRNKQQTRPGDEARSDRAAKALRDRLDHEDKVREGEETHSPRT